MNIEIEKYVKQYGEQHRKLITDALTFLEAEESTWYLDSRIDKDEFVDSLIKSSRRIQTDEV